MSVLLMARPRPAFSDESQHFLDWLRGAMRSAGFDANQSRLAEAMKTTPSTVNSWFTRGALPGRDTLGPLAEALRVSISDVRRAAGYPESEEAPAPDVPAWLTAVLAELDDYEQSVVGETARGLLRLREERARYGTPPPPADREETPPPPPPPPRTMRARCERLC